MSHFRLSIDMNMGNGPARQCRAISREGLRCSNSRPSGADLCSTHERQRIDFNRSRDQYHRPPPTSSSPSYHHRTASATSAYSSYKQSRIEAMDREMDALRSQRASSRSRQMQELDAEIAALSANNNRRRDNELHASRLRTNDLAEELSTANAQLAAERIRNGEAAGLRSDLANRDAEIAALRAREIETKRRMLATDEDVKYWKGQASDYEAQGRDVLGQLEDAQILIEDKEYETKRRADDATYWREQALDYKAQGRGLLDHLEDAQVFIEDGERKAREDQGLYFRDV
ncbi:Myosin ii heavy chain [Lasiodiplodia theobromae]|uniref:Myosin ii heavy chain n=1 Tax=Lasiodiplodia theobromae TaxID=45133 RepID=UPI0015C3EC3F|nr:Myosin ii heavy chain [Lasiodiplodia theobromae]KAF4538190.1 Myosin ii heavy chain [Lasiodiplodia theobromae]